MNPEDVIPGLSLVLRYRLRIKEIEVLLPFFERNYTAIQLAEFLKIPVGNVHPIIQRLRLRNLIILTGKDEKGSNILGFNPDSV